MTYTVQPFRATDLAALHYNAEAAWTFAHLPAFETAELYACHPAWTWRRGDVLLACAGMLLPWEGLGRLWAVLSVEAAQYPMVARSLLRRVWWCRDHYQLRRIEAQIRAEFYQGRLLASWMGLTGSRVLTQYGPGGEDFVELTWLRPKE